MLAFTTLAVLALSAVNAAPIPSRRATAPAGWASSYLESYDVYHTRYVALGCAALKVNDYSAWDTCCHPLLANESLSTRPAQCIPSSAASSSAAVAVATSSTEDDEECEATSTSESAAAATTTSSSKAAVVAAAKTTSTSSPAAQKTTSSSAAAAATTTASSSSSSSATETGGYATYFMQNGNAGACGNVNSENSKIAAIPYHWWATSDSQASSRCGQQIEITRVDNGKTVTVEVADLCPTCVNDNSLDLSVGAFTALGTESEGMLSVEWKWL